MFYVIIIFLLSNLVAIFFAIHPVTRSSNNLLSPLIVKHSLILARISAFFLILNFIDFSISHEEILRLLRQLLNQ